MSSDAARRRGRRPRKSRRSLYPTPHTRVHALALAETLVDRLGVANVLGDEQVVQKNPKL